jgi:chromosome partitioning protein
MDVIEGLIKANKRLSKEELNYREFFSDSCKSKSEIDSLTLNHSYPASDVAKMCGMRGATFKAFAKKAIQDKHIPPVIKSSNQFQYTLRHIQVLLDLAKRPSWADLNNNTHIINIGNQKGGTGKSTTAISLAASIALKVELRPRTLIIDLDPQGSQSQFAYIDVEGDDDILTAVDLMLGDSEPKSVYKELIDEGFSHNEIVKDSIINTHIPNLHVLPAYPTDERFNSKAWETSLENARNGDEGVSMPHLSYLKEKIIDVVKGDYDFIIIDTAPQSNPLVWAALEASTALLIPCTPHTLDWTSTHGYIKQLPHIIDRLPSQGENLEWWKVLATNFDDEYSRDQQILDRMKDALGSDLFNVQIKRSQAFEKANQNYRTVLDIKKKEELCSDRQLEKAVDSLRDVTRELLNSLKETNSEE